MDTRDSLIDDNGQMTKIAITLPVLPADTTLPFGNTGEINTKVIPRSDNAEYYQFTIDTYGWYNIDMLLKIGKNVQTSMLTVNIQVEFRTRVSVFLVIPSANFFAEGGVLKNSDAFGFDENTGSIPLPQETDAFVFAVSEQNEKLFFAQKHFITSPSQTIDLNLNESDSVTILSSFKLLKFENINMTISKAKNFEGTKDIDKEMEAIRKEINKSNCNCQTPDNFADTTMERPH